MNNTKAAKKAQSRALTIPGDVSNTFTDFDLWTSKQLVLAWIQAFTAQKHTQMYS